ncbi:PH domain-containing protein [Candidatus Microgenomates bacterium]|nr:PH domain-containing protein [Candidatus Microgenomates bacterium]
MAKKENPNQIPKKFRKLNKSFLDHLQHNNNNSFMAFPKGLSFLGKEQEENVILIVRTHWIMYLPHILAAIFSFLLPFIFRLVIPELSENLSLFIVFFILSGLVFLSISVFTLVKWYFNVNIITDQRVVDLDFTSVMSHTSSEARLEKIEDVTHKQIGLIGSIFDVGTVYIQTAGAKAEIEFDNVPRPREIQDILYDLLESKQKGEI